MSIILPQPSEPTLEPPPALFAETMAMIAIEGLDVTEEGVCSVADPQPANWVITQRGGHTSMLPPASKV